MKFPSTSWLALFFSLVAFSPVVEGAPQNRALPASGLKATRPSEKTSWLFLLQTRTQWLLVLQENGQSPQSGSSSGTLTPLSASGSSAGSSASSSVGASVATPSQKGGSAALGVADGTDADGSETTTLIFEGNTLDIPLEPEIPSAKPSKPSAPAS